MNEHDPSVELRLLAALKREMQRPAEDAVMRDVATRLGTTLGIGLSVAAPAMAIGAAPGSFSGAASAASAAVKLSAASHPLLAPLAVLFGSAAVTGVSLFGVLSLTGPPSAPPLEPRKARTVAVAPTARSAGRTRPSSPASSTVVSESPMSSEPARPPARPMSSAASVPLVLTVPTSSAAPAEASLGAQQALLDTARRALSRGASATALEALEGHAARFPRSVLEEEREALIVKALRAAQRNAEANQRAARFAARYPSSVFLPSVGAPSIP
jgi:hypothetical protein